jgi:hypothetical protein
MGLSDIREELHKFINSADEQVLNLLYAMVQPDSGNSSLTPKEQKEIDKRIASHNSGESKSYSWDEARKQIEGK